MVTTTSYHTQTHTQRLSTTPQNGSCQRHIEKLGPPIKVPLQSKTLTIVPDLAKLPTTLQQFLGYVKSFLANQEDKTCAPHSNCLPKPSIPTLQPPSSSRKSVTAHLFRGEKPEPTHNLYS